VRERVAQCLDLVLAEARKRTITRFMGLIVASMGMQFVLVA